MITIKNTHWIALALIYIAFFSLIGFAVYFTKNPNCLWALLLTPSYRNGEGCDCGEDEDFEDEEEQLS